MTKEIQRLHDVWLDNQNKSIQSTVLPKITFDDLTNSIISTGPFYYYVIDFFDMSVSHVSPSITDFHEFGPDNVSFNDILGTMHPDDIEFVTKTEAAIADFFYTNLDREKLLKYKISYNLRGKLRNGEYILCNHQALMLTMDENGGYGKSLNIHTRIDHLAIHNNHQFSLIGLDGEPSYMNLNVDSDIKTAVQYSKREVDIIKNIADGLSSIEIAEKLFISDLTVKKHRKNILNKSSCKNTAQLVKTCILQGVI